MYARFSSLWSNYTYSWYIFLFCLDARKKTDSQKQENVRSSNSNNNNHHATWFSAFMGATF